MVENSVGYLVDGMDEKEDAWMDVMLVVVMASSMAACSVEL